MKTHLVTGGCGFVGRNMVKRLWATTDDQIIVVDDLSTGVHPSAWLDAATTRKGDGFAVFGSRLLFLHADVQRLMSTFSDDLRVFEVRYGFAVDRISDVFHFAAIVGGRAKIEGDPMAVALDLAIDAGMFHWACRYIPDRFLYPSSSAAYPADLQTDHDARALKEGDISFENLCEPDMTYGWSKLTGEYLSRIAASRYGLKVTCIRPFSGYGEDQDPTYPVTAIATRAARREDPFEVWGSGHQTRDFVHIDDVIDCMLLAMDHIHDGTAINIGTGRPTSFREIIAIMASFAGYDPAIRPLGDMPVGVQHRYADMTLVQEKLGWKARIPLEAGMRRVYDATVHKLIG